MAEAGDFNLSKVLLLSLSHGDPVQASGEEAEVKGAQTNGTKLGSGQQSVEGHFSALVECSGSHAESSGNDLACHQTCFTKRGQKEYAAGAL